ncbi:MAG: restriction endonuclease [Lentisphaerae bacterium]|jgi:type II restriction enzyme|nr:restriction endonuclease [Lentisphaerota bacterium]
MKRKFNEWIATFRESIAGYDYYTDFQKVYANVDAIKIPLNILNSLVGSKNIKDDFIRLIKNYPETVPCIPILLAVRASQIYAIDDSGEMTYIFSEKKHTPEEYAVFMEKTGLFTLLSEHIIRDLIDYVTGVEVGLDSNGRKNRGGHVMENLVEKYIQKAGFIKGQDYFKEMYISEIQGKFGIDMSMVSNDGKAEKRFDFVVKTMTQLYVIETNFYASSGSKLNETARSYKTLANEIENIPGVTFVWFTDGAGWRSAKHNLEETFDVLDTIYNIKDLEDGIAQKLFV